MIVNAEQATDFIIRCIKAKLTCMLSGDPGIGKSAIIQSIADKFNLELIDIRLSTYDPVDLNGFPMVKGDLAEYIPMNTFPLKEITKKPEGKTGWLVFLDEFNSASLAVQAASYKLVLDRQVGQHELHPNTAIVCAGNLITNGAIVNRLGTAMQSRLVHLELGVVPTEWIKWGTKNNIDHRILAYINHVPDNLHKFDPKHDDKTFSCPRTWAFLSHLIRDIPTDDLGELRPLLAGTVGEGSAVEFVAFTEIYANLPTYQDILKDPMNARLDTEPAMLFAVSHMITAYLKKKDLDKAMQYIERLPIEFQTITLQNAVQKDQSIIKETEIDKWAMKNGGYLL